MEYPLQISFKIIAIARQLSVRDAHGQLVFYVRQKAFKLKEAVRVFADQEQTRLLYSINADRVIDWSARYNFTDAAGNYLGSVKRQGMRSLWRAHYDVFDGEQIVLTITEESPWTKFLDGVVGEIPVVGMFTGYMFHPAYLVKRTNGAIVMRAEKRPAFFEGKFDITRHGDLDPREETRALLALMMMTLLERRRG